LFAEISQGPPELWIAAAFSIMRHAAPRHPATCLTWLQFGSCQASGWFEPPAAMACWRLLAVVQSRGGIHPSCVPWINRRLLHKTQHNASYHSLTAHGRKLNTLSYLVWLQADVPVHMTLHRRSVTSRQRPPIALLAEHLPRSMACIEYRWDRKAQVDRYRPVYVCSRRPLALIQCVGIA
jgi:hypothetical protein